VGEEAAVFLGCEHAGVSLSRRQLRTLRAIERQLAHSEPDLEASFWSFFVQARGRGMPGVEHVASRPSRALVPRWRGRSVTERVKDWCAENWHDP
jgi:hypothetical protein